MRRDLSIVFAAFLCVLAHPALTHAQVRFESGAENAFDANGTSDGENEIEMDRDSFTPSTSVVGESRFVSETAYSFIDNRGAPENHSLPEILARYGVSENVELCFGWNYEFG